MHHQACTNNDNNCIMEKNYNKQASVPTIHDATSNKLASMSRPIIMQQHQTCSEHQQDAQQTKTVQHAVHTKTYTTITPTIFLFQTSKRFLQLFIILQLSSMAETTTTISYSPYCWWKSPTWNNSQHSCWWTDGSLWNHSRLQKPKG